MNFKANYHRRVLIRKTLLFMKITTLLLFSACLTASAGGFAQRVTLSANDVKIEKIFKEIKKQTGYVFFYEAHVLPETKRVSVHVKNETVGEVLKEVLQGEPVDFSILRKTIIIVKKKNQPATTNSVVPISQPEEIIRSAPVNIITGSVKDAHGNALTGVSVVIKGTNRGTSTDTNGGFSIDANIGDVLEFTIVGYQKKSVTVGKQTEINVRLELEVSGLSDVVVVGYGTQKKSDLTGAITQVDASVFQYQPTTQFTEMLAGTVAGFSADQSTSAKGGASMEIRGPTSLNAGNSPLVVVDGAIFYGSVSEINPYDIESINILKDASSAAIFGSKAASGVIIITTKKGRSGKPTINFNVKTGLTENYNQRRGLGPEAFTQFRSDYFRQAFPNQDYNYYTRPDKLPNSMTIEQWRALSNAPLTDDLQEWMSRLQFTSEEKAGYVSGKTIDAYDYVFRKGISQDYDLSISGGTNNATYYWSLGYNNIEGIRVGDQYSSVRSRLNADFKIANWMNVGMNAQFSDRDEGAVPASTTSFYEISPYGQMFDDNGDLVRLPNGQYTNNPLLDYYRTSLLDKTNSLFANLYTEIKLPLGIKFKVSFQPRYEATKYFTFTTISDKLGGLPNEIPSGQRIESSTMNWMIDNLLTWRKDIGSHSFDITLLANSEKNRYWSSSMSNRDFSPNQQLGFDGLQFGNSPGISNNDTKSTGDALMARLNYSFLAKYLLTASVRQDGYSAFGLQNPRAVFPAIALAWVVSNEKFFNVDLINRLKVRASWGGNGNRDIGIYSAMAQMVSSLWFDGSNTRVGVNTSTLANYGLKWERTESFNLGLDMSLLENKINLTADAYIMKTNDLLMNRIVPAITGFNNITSNLGELGNRGFEMTLNTVNISQSDFTWKSNLVFSLNRNKINKLFGDVSSYTLLGKTQTGEVPDFSNQWFPGHAIDVVWDYKVVGIWQEGEAAEATKYGLKPGDFKVLDVNGDFKYIDINDKQFIGHDVPQYRLGLRNDFTFLKNFTASIFVRADLGQLGSFPDAMNSVYGIYDRVNKATGPLPYWTAQNPNYEYPRLNPTSYGIFGGGIMIYKPRSFVRIQDVSLAYNLTSAIAQQTKLNNLQIFASVRNLATFTKWPGWDPESGMDPMPRTYTLGINLSL
jgi:TonB-linked SusC/RagA family outer membrane protein